MAKQPGFWDVEERSEEISADGDPLETLAEAVDFERFRPILEAAAGRPPGPKGGRPALDVVLKFRMLMLQSFHGLSLAPPARQRRRKGRDQGGTGGRGDMTRRARQGGAEGHGRALDRQVPQGEAPAGRRGAGRHRHPGVRLQVPHQRGPEARDHPPPDRDGRRRP